MNYKTLEVELENGRVLPSAGEALPAKAHALLTILSSTAEETATENGPSLADLMADSCGIGLGKHADLSTNRAHMDDFGR